MTIKSLDQGSYSEEEIPRGNAGLRKKIWDLGWTRESVPCRPRTVVIKRTGPVGMTGDVF